MLSTGMSHAESERERRPVNPHATVSVGRSEAGELYHVYDLDGNRIKEEAKVAPQGTIYVGANHAGDEVIIEPV